MASAEQRHMPLLPPLLLLLCGLPATTTQPEATDVRAALGLGAADVAVGPNGASLLGATGRPAPRWEVLRSVTDLGALRAAAAAHLGIDQGALVLADGRGREVGSLAQAVASGAVYGRSRAERWMWPAHRAGDRLAVEPAERCEAGAEQCSAGAGLVLETLSVSPRVFRVPSLLSASEVAELTALVASPALCADAGMHPAYCEWQPSVISGRESGRDPRTSSTTWVGPIFGNVTKKPPFGPSALLKAVLGRVAALVGAEPGLAEGMQVVRYGAGEHYHAHADYHTGRRGTEGYDGSRGFYNDPSVNRFASVLIYLNGAEAGGFSGGETNFPLAAECPEPALAATECGAGWGEGDDAKYHAARNRPWGRGGEAIADCGAGLRVAPRSGDGLLFYNMEVSRRTIVAGHLGCILPRVPAIIVRTGAA